ncbi:MAG: MoxR family ATPase [Spirochaetales bacterium]|nr:MoxR family ATPase [Spirochaetales bacterium]
MAQSEHKKLLEKIKTLKEQINSVFVGNEIAIHSLLIGFLSGLHVLIEDIPGVGKTTLAKTLAKSAGLDFARIQFTPDLLPGDIIGMTVWSTEKRDFIFKPGAIMHQFILADEVNRASARTQSSLLESMQEHAVTVDGKTYTLPEPFFVIATQNPISFTGTFQLPEAQVDRFGVCFSVGYPSESEEELILSRFKEKDPLLELKAVIEPKHVMIIRDGVRKVFVDDKIKSFIVAIARKTRTNSKIRLGMSPRAAQHLLLACQTEAFLAARTYVIPEDVLNVVPVVIPHRIILRAEARVEDITAAKVIQELIAGLAIPTGLSQ